MRKCVRKWVALFVCLACVVCMPQQVMAADQTITVSADENKSVELQVGDTGTIVPVPSISQTMSDYDDDFYDDSDVYQKQLPVRFIYEVDDSDYYYYYDDEPCISIDENGRYQAKTAGTDTVRIIGYGANGISSYYATVKFTVNLDMSQVTLSKTETQAYIFAEKYGETYYYPDVTLSIPFNSPFELNDDMITSVQSSDEDVSAEASIENNQLCLDLQADKKCSTKLTMTIGGKQFELFVTLQPVIPFENSYMLERGKTKSFKLSGYSGKVDWTSTNPKVASVSSKGVVKGKTIGNTVIVAKIEDQRVGCALSVTKKGMKQVCARASYIGDAKNGWIYDQNKRAQKGYYDCSSLVWRAYKEKMNVNFGSPSWPGWTGSEAAWCRDHKKMMKGGFSFKKLEKMQMNPGDLIFKSGNLKKPYSTTSHVEMFTGYSVVGFDGSKPILQGHWASREDGYEYTIEEGSLWARPTK